MQPKPRLNFRPAGGRVALRRLENDYRAAHRKRKAYETTADLRTNGLLTSGPTVRYAESGPRTSGARPQDRFHFAPGAYRMTITMDSQDTPQKTLRTSAFVTDQASARVEHLWRFLGSAEFTKETLRSLLGDDAKSSYDKLRLAKLLAEKIENNSINTQTALLAFVKQPRCWLSFKVGERESTVLPNAQDPHLLFTSFDQSGLFGPIQEYGINKAWYVVTERIHLGGRNWVRWHAIAEIGSDYLAITWIGFGYEKEDRHETFSYWNFLPSVFQRVERHIGGAWRHSNLHSLMLNDLWNKYQDNPDYTWVNERVRAESNGIVFNAHAGYTDFDGSGLEKLARKVARQNLGALGMTEGQNPTELVLLEKSVLRTFIKEWGTKAFQVKLNRREHGREVPLFRAYVYFGASLARIAANAQLSGSLTSPKFTQDSLQHIYCYSRYGLSERTLEFLLSEIRQHKRGRDENS